jgi:hypothetical protein
MEGVESNVSQKNRDKFSSAVSAFKRELSQQMAARRPADIIDINTASKPLRTANSMPSLFGAANQ